MMLTLSVYPHRVSLKNMPALAAEFKGRIGSDSRRGQAYFSGLPGVDIHSCRVTSQASDMIVLGKH